MRPSWRGAKSREVRIDVCLRCRVASRGCPRLASLEPVGARRGRATHGTTRDRIGIPRSEKASLLRSRPVRFSRPRHMQIQASLFEVPVEVEMSYAGNNAPMRWRAMASPSNGGTELPIC